MGFRDEFAWAGGGGWQPDPPPDPPPEPPKPTPKPKPAPATPLPKASAPAPGSSGLVCGRFLPLHRGHEMLIEFARDSVEALTVLVFAEADDEIPGTVRAAWIRAQFPAVKVGVVEGERPKPEQPDFAARFIAACASWRPTGKRMFFSSEESGRAAAEALAATLVFVDPARVIVPISGTMLRQDLLGNYGYLARPTRPAFVRRIAIVGAESTGKSTLARSLAERFDTALVPEQARIVAEQNGGELSLDGIVRANEMQAELEEERALEANRLLFCDTEAITAQLWYERLGELPAPPMLVARRYDAWLVCGDDVPFVGAPARDQPEARRAFATALWQKLRQHNANAVRLTGSWDARTTKAIQTIDELLARRGFLAARAPSLFQAIRSSGTL